MLLDIVLAAFAGLAITVTLWSLAIAFGRNTTPSVRRHAMDVFRIAWKTAVATVLAAVIRFYASGLVDPALPVAGVPAP